MKCLRVSMRGILRTTKAQTLSIRRRDTGLITIAVWFSERSYAVRQAEEHAICSTAHTSNSRISAVCTLSLPAIIRHLSVKVWSSLRSFVPANRHMSLRWDRLRKDCGITPLSIGRVCTAQAPPFARHGASPLVWISARYTR